MAKKNAAAEVTGTPASNVVEMPVQTGAPSTPAAVVAGPVTLDLDAILKNILEKKPAGAAGPTASKMATSIKEKIPALIAAAQKAGVKALPFNACVKQIAVGLGVDPTKRTQYFYNLAQDVASLMEPGTTERDGRKVYLVIPAAEAEAEVSK